MSKKILTLLASVVFLSLAGPAQGKKEKPSYIDTISQVIENERTNSPPARIEALEKQIAKLEARVAMLENRHRPDQVNK